MTASTRAVVSRQARQARYRARQREKLARVTASGWESPALGREDAATVAWAAGLLSSEVEAGIIRDPAVKDAIEVLVGLVSRRLSWARPVYDRGRAGLPRG